METLAVIGGLLIPVALLVIGVIVKPYLDQKVKEGNNNIFVRLCGWACKYVEAKYNSEVGKVKFETALDEVKKLCEKEKIPFDADKAKTVIENFVFESNIQGIFGHKEE